MWGTSEAAAFRAASTAAFLREIAGDERARRGAFRMIDIARRSGSSEVTFAGVKVSALTSQKKRPVRARTQTHKSNDNEAAAKGLDLAEASDSQGGPRNGAAPPREAGAPQSSTTTPVRALDQVRCTLSRRARGRQPKPSALASRRRGRR